MLKRSEGSRLKRGFFMIQFVLTTSLILFIQTSSCIRFILQPHTTKCLRHEMYANQLAKGEYEISSLPGTRVDLTITDYTSRHLALKRENINGKEMFAFTSDQKDDYELCFTYTSVLTEPATNYAPREIYVDYLVGAEAKTKEDSYVSEDKLNELEAFLTRIEDLSESIIIDFAQLKKRGRDMRDTNESTNRRMFYQVILSIIVLVALAIWQVLYLRMFFKSKKLID